MKNKFKLKKKDNKIGGLCVSRLNSLLNTGVDADQTLCCQPLTGFVRA